MRFRPLSKKSCALILILALLAIRLGSVSHTVFVEPVQQYISQVAYMADGDIKPGAPGFKHKRFLSDAPVVVEIFAPPLFVPQTPALYLPAPTEALPEVYLKSFIPPA